jgi:iron-sulfur cluster repair protein YtfE (RIC family)
MTTSNEAIRKAILDEHEQLRTRMKALQEALDDAAQRPAVEGGVPPALVSALDSFLSEFLKHIAHEDVVLRPLLASLDAWARERVEHLDAEHREQRERLQALATMSPSADPAAFTARVRETLAWIRADMAGEERELLTPEVLRDDVVVIDSFGG